MDLLPLRLALAARWLFAALLLVIAVLALAPMDEHDEGFGSEVTSGSDKSDHLAAFGTLALVGVAAWGRTRRPHVVAAVLAYGAAIELLQTQIPGRSGDWIDLAADGLGIALGLLLAALLQRLRSKRIALEGG